MSDKPEAGRTFINPLQRTITPTEVAWLFNLSPSVISDALAKRELERTFHSRGKGKGHRYLFVNEAVEWRLRRVCPHLYKPLARPIGIHDYNYIPETNDYRPPKRSAPRGAVVTWWRCARQDCPGRRGEFPMTPSAKPSYCPFCGKSTALNRVKSNAQ